MIDPNELHGRFLLFKTSVMYCSVNCRTSTGLRLMDFRSALTSGSHLNYTEGSSKLRNMDAAHPCANLFHIQPVKLNLFTAKLPLTVASIFCFKNVDCESVSYFQPC